MSGRWWVVIGAYSAAVAVGLGAMGAHLLEDRLAEKVDTFEVGVRYHLAHSVGLILIGMLASRQRQRLLTLAAWALAGGIVLFSGGLYVWSLTGSRGAVHVVPFGGVAFILGWCLLGTAAWTSGREVS